MSASDAADLSDNSAGSNIPAVMYKAIFTKSGNIPQDIFDKFKKVQELYGEDRWIIKGVKDGSETLGNSSEIQWVSDALESWLQLNPNLQIRIFDRNSAQAYIGRINLSDQRAFDTILPYAFKSDWFRYLILNQEGGWWSDMRMVCKALINELVPKDANFFNAAENNLIGTTTGSPELETVIEQVRRRVFAGVLVRYRHESVLPNPTCDSQYTGPTCIECALGYKYMFGSPDPHLRLQFQDSSEDVELAPGSKQTHWGWRIVLPDDTWPGHEHTVDRGTDRSEKIC